MLLELLELELLGLELELLELELELLELELELLALELELELELELLVDVFCFWDAWLSLSLLSLVVLEFSVLVELLELVICSFNSFAVLASFLLNSSCFA